MIDKWLHYRKTAFHWVTRNNLPGDRCTSWQILIHWLLFPLVSFYLHMQKSIGLDMESGQWKFYGVTWLDRDLYTLSRRDGAVYGIRIQNGRATLLANTGDGYVKPITADSSDRI